MPNPSYLRRALAAVAALAVVGPLFLASPTAGRSIVTKGGRNAEQQPEAYQPADPTRNMTPEQRARWCRDHPGQCG